jgi:hypothetical protein
MAANVKPDYRRLVMESLIGGNDAIPGMCVNCANWNGGEIIGECRLAAENHAKYEETGDPADLPMIAAPLLTQRWFGCNQFRNQGERK